MMTDTVKRSFRSEVTYLNHQYDMTVFEICRAEDHRLYKIELNQLKYWLIKKEECWHFVADFLPTAKLRALVIKEIERLTACIMLRLPQIGVSQLK